MIGPVREGPYFRPAIGMEERRAVDETLASGWLTSGPQVKKFEASFASYLGVRHAVPVNSCTAALHLSLEALGVGPGDAVLTPTMTFAATAAVVCQLGARPVLVDCEPRTLCIDPEALARAGREWKGPGQLKAMIAMHYGGQMADMFRVAALGRELGVPVLEDAAHALPASIRESPGHPWISVGHTSPLTCFSFYANKCITTGEGGMVVTQDAALADRIRLMSLHGLSRSAWNRFQVGGSWHYEILSAGYKYNLTDLAAALGVTQLQKADRFRAERKAIAESYAEQLRPYAELIETPKERKDRQSAWHIYPIRLRLNRWTIDRGAFIQQLAERGITCSVQWMPLHLHPFYQQQFGYRPGDFPVATAEWVRLASLPIFPGMTEEEVDYVCRAIREVVSEYRKPLYPVGTEAVA